jgi:predicted glycosyltransferase involved in capsule biosynthesis
MDSDLFFSEEQYDMVYSHIVELENTSNRMFFTYNLMDIHENERKEVLKLEKIELNTDKLEELKPKYSWRHSWGAGVLGGIFIVPRKEIREMGGFNENFLTWGAEDDEAHTRIKGYAEWRPKMNQGPYHLWHPKNEKDEKYFIPVYSDEYFKVNKVEKPR